MRLVALEQKLTYANLTTSEEFDFVGEFVLMEAGKLIGLRVEIFWCCGTGVFRAVLRRSPPHCCTNPTASCGTGHGRGRFCPLQLHSQLLLSCVSKQ